MYKFFHLTNGERKYTYADFASPFITGVTCLLAIVMQGYQRRKGKVTSAILFHFWFLLLLCSSVTYIQQIKNFNQLKESNQILFEFIVKSCHTFFILAIFVFHCFSEPKQDIQKRSPKESSSYLSKLFFSWHSPLIFLGYQKPLEKDDVWELESNDVSQKVGVKFRKLWKKELQKSRLAFEAKAIDMEYKASENSVKEVNKKINYKDFSYNASLWKCITKQYWRSILAAVLYRLFQDLIQFLKPVLLSELIHFISDRDAPLYQGYVIAVSMYAVSILQSVCLQQYYFTCYVVGMRMRTSLITVIYDKALTISNSARQESSMGEIVNLMSNDAQRLQDLMTNIIMLFSSPFVITIAVFMLWKHLQAGVLVGLLVMILAMPFNGLVMKKMKSLSAVNMKFKDERMKITSEVLNGIKVLKMYAWEKSFEERIEEIRAKELSILRKVAFLKAISFFLSMCTPFVVTTVSFGVYLAISPDNILDPTTTFVSISLFNIIKFPLRILPTTFSSVVQAQVSVKRITNFLYAPEIDKNAVNRDHEGVNQIKIKHGSFSWGEIGQNCLHDITLKVKPGELIAVVGHVGSGKSSLISALLGEMEKTRGYVGMRGSVAYVPQQAWIQNATVKENIFFGKQHVKKKHPNEEDKFYKKIVDATCLRSDFDNFPAYDETEIGEKGVNLSGGQKQRVSLARAVYQDCDVYLMDDPLSAVDSNVGSHIFEHVIGCNGLLKNKTRILVTHNVNHLSKVDRIVVLENGRISEMGTYKTLLHEGSSFFKFVEKFAVQKQNDEKGSSSSGSIGDIISEKLNYEFYDNYLDAKSAKENLKEQLSKVKKNLSKTGTSKKETKDEIKLSKGKLIKKETIEKGSVKLSVLTSYIKAIGISVFSMVFSVEFFFQAAVVGSSVWIQKWSEDAVDLSNAEFRSQTGLKMGVYAGFGCLQALFVMVEVYFLAIGCLSASTKIHRTLLCRILTAPASFFDTTPLGRIINRFSKDVFVIDEKLPWSIRSSNLNILSVLGVIFVIVYSTPLFGLVIIPVGAFYYAIQRYFIRTSRQLKRMESATRSPIYQHFSETVSGAAVVRAFEAQERFKQTSMDRVDLNQKFTYSNIVSNRWLAIRLNTVGNAIVFFAALFAVIQRETVNGSIAGLSLSYALKITVSLSMLVKNMSETELYVVSAERLKEYSEVESEAPLEIKDAQLKDNWPSRGQVEFNDYCTRYRKGLDLVVKNVKVVIKAGEKVGIVGRTGAGKSSLALSLFRIIEATQGNITIDGIEISKIGLHQLRSKLTIIPQDPLLFSGTIRMNLDPLNSHTDPDIWRALDHCNLRACVSFLPDKLHHTCSEGGQNFSVGQRQLICLARALLRRSKIIVLDEATAAVDLKSDELIQKTIRDQFRESTVIAIAHRLNTVLDYDKILVLSKGEVKEFESPKILLENHNSMFYAMAKDDGIL